MRISEDKRAIWGQHAKALIGNKFICNKLCLMDGERGVLTPYMEKLLTVEQLSEILQVSRRTIYDWTHTGFIPHYKFPRGVRFKWAEIDQWLIKRKHQGRKKYIISI